MKKVLSVSLCVLMSMILFIPVLRADKQQDTYDRMNSSIEVLTELLNIPEGGVPRGLLKKCQGLVIIPHMVKGAFIVGAARGKGIMIHRLPGGKWSNPSFVTITAGSVGFQIGGQATDLLLVINNERGFQAMLEDNFKFGANASVAAGPVGRDAAAGTDAKLKADIVSYSRSKGVFAGISLDGAGLTNDTEANTAFYGKLVNHRTLLSTQNNPYPEAARPLLKILGPFGPAKTK